MDELQRIWNVRNNLSKDQDKDEASLRAMLNSRSVGEFKKISKVMSWDAVLMIVTSLSFISVAFIIDLERRYEVSLLLLGLMVLLGLHYWINHRLINRYDYQGRDIVTIISKKLKYLRWNTYLYLYGIPIVTFALYIYVLSIGSRLPAHLTVLDIVIGILLPLISYYFSKWLNNRLYGKQIKTLEKLIDDFID